MSSFFKFEEDFIQSLRCIPMIVRYKLDTCGVKLKLNHWHLFNTEEKEFLVNKPCETLSDINNYRNYLRDLVKEKTGEYPKDLSINPDPEWLINDKIPCQVQEKAQEFDFEINLYQWQNITNLQRFTLIKLSKSGHENRNFLPALKEFNLINNE